MSTARSDLIDHPGLPLPLAIRIHPRARRLKLRLDGEHLLLTCPPRASRRAALAWALDQRAWIEAQLATVPKGQPFVPGACFPLEGEDVVIHWDETGPRSPSFDCGTLTVGGSLEGLSRRVERWLRDRARLLLSNDTAAAAQIAGVSVRSVSVGDAGTRWGSCSASGAIRYNWRLVLAPPPVRRWVVAHEVAHRVHMNHGPAFKALEARLYGGNVAAARSELRRLGPRLKGVGRGL